MRHPPPLLTHLILIPQTHPRLECDFSFPDSQTLPHQQPGLTHPQTPLMTSLPFSPSSLEPRRDQEWQHPVPQHCPSNALMTLPSFPALDYAPLPPTFLSAPSGRAQPQLRSAPPSGHLSPHISSCCCPASLTFPTPAQDLEAERLLHGLQNGSRERRRETLHHLVLLAPDVTFAQEVISRDGLQRLGTIIEDGDE